MKSYPELHMPLIQGRDKLHHLLQAANPSLMLWTLVHAWNHLATEEDNVRTLREFHHRVPRKYRTFMPASEDKAILVIGCFTYNDEDFKFVQDQIAHELGIPMHHKMGTDQSLPKFYSWAIQTRCQDDPTHPACQLTPDRIDEKMAEDVKHPFTCIGFFDRSPLAVQHAQP